MSVSTCVMEAVLSEIKVTSRELRTVREAMRELNRMVDALGEGELQKVVLTHRNEWRAVVLPIADYDAMLKAIAVCSATGGTFPSREGEPPTSTPSRQERPPDTGLPAGASGANVLVDTTPNCTPAGDPPRYL